MQLLSYKQKNFPYLKKKYEKFLFLIQTLKSLFLKFFCAHIHLVILYQTGIALFGAGNDANGF